MKKIFILFLFLSTVVISFAQSSVQWEQYKRDCRNRGGTIDDVYNIAKANGGCHLPTAPSPSAAERERKTQAEEADRKGLEASDRGDWKEATDRFSEALEFDPGNAAIRQHLNHAKDLESAAQIDALREQDKDRGTAAQIEAIRERFHVEAIQLAIPTACLVAGQLTSTAACDVIDAVGVGWEAGSKNEHIELLRVLDMEIAKKAVFLSFPAEMEMGHRVAFVQELYNAVAREFAAVASRIEFAMQHDQLTARLRTEYAIRDAAAVDTLRNLAVDESRRSSESASLYLRSHTESRGLTFRCESACRKLVGAARSANLFD